MFFERFFPEISMESLRFPSPPPDHWLPPSSNYFDLRLPVAGFGGAISSPLPFVRFKQWYPESPGLGRGPFGYTFPT